jgi:hypothetical protein
MYRPFRPTAISGHTRLTSGHTRVISGHKMAETYHAIYTTGVIVKGSFDYLIGMIFKEQIGLMRDVRGALAGSPLALEIFNEFMDGYIVFQYSHSRHRLREIGAVLGGKE